MINAQLDRSEFAALIPAAGSSTRMGLGTSKPLLKLAGLTVLEHTLSRLRESEVLSKIVVMARAEDLSQMRAITERFKEVDLIQGGASRSHSVRLGLEHLAQNHPSQFVLVHDAVRCLVSAQLIRAVAVAVKQHGAVTAALPVVDTVKEIGPDGLIARTLERDKLIAVQTPQAFRSEILQRAHSSLAGSLAEASDDASLVEPFHPVYIVPGERSNFKITEPFDLKMAQMLLDQ